MGTRGFITFVVDGNEKTTYNHFDSYPAGLGITVLTWLRDVIADEDALRDQVRALRTVDWNSKPTEDDIERLKGYANVNVSERSLEDWYCLLYETHGNLVKMMEAGVVSDNRDFPRDSLFAEWGYCVDLDARAFEVYRGFQTSAHDLGRFADREPIRDNSVGGTSYYPVALAATWPLDALPDDGEFLKIEGEEDE